MGSVVGVEPEKRKKSESGKTIIQGRLTSKDRAMGGRGMSRSWQADKKWV